MCTRERWLTYYEKTNLALCGVMCVRVCYFGAYAPNYSRNRIIIKGLKKNGAKVVECQDLSSKGFWGLVLRHFRLLRKHLRLADYDVMIIGVFDGQFVTPLARLISKSPVVLDLFTGLHETKVVDREIINKDSLRAKAYYCLDKYAPRLVDLILSDTNAHIEYFHRLSGAEIGKFRRLFIGSDDEVFYPRTISKDDEHFVVLFWGGFIPLQGIRYIVEAAKILQKEKNITFRIIGHGQTYGGIIKLAERLGVKNVKFEPPVVYNELPNHIAEADACLGIFGQGDKARRVIPNKVFEALAMKKPVITGNSSAAQEVLQNGKNCLLCEMADPKAIATAVAALYEDEKLRKKIAENGYVLYKNKFTPEVIGRDLIGYLNKFVNES